MAEFESTSVETTEVADPSEEVTGVEEQSAADSVSEETVEETVEETGKTEEDAAWARMRREAQQARADAEAAQRELAELKAMDEARAKAESRLTGQDDARIAAIAEATGMSEDEVRAEIEAAEREAQKDLLIENLQTQIDTLTGERMMQDELEEIRKVDPTVKSLMDLGEEYVRYMSATDPATGKPMMTPQDAYWAVKAKEQANKATPPVEVGKVATGTAEKDYFTDAEIDAMSPEQLTNNAPKIIASWERNYKNRK